MGLLGTSTLPWSDFVSSSQWNMYSVTKEVLKLGVVVHTHDHCIQEAKDGGPSVHGQSELHSEISSQKSVSLSSPLSPPPLLSLFLSNRVM